VSRPQLWVVAGPNGAGKSTLTSRHLLGRLPIVNSDNIAVELDSSRRSDTAIVLRACRMALEARERLLAERQSFSFETTLTGHGEIRFMQKAATAGYKVNPIFVGLDDVASSHDRVQLRTRRRP
jgi:predicted ABC-type ATPase